jgi:tripartite-type tricarboxylate transporter receptor subunit TctC
MKRAYFVWVLALIVGDTCAAFAQGYPSRPITVVVPFAAGGPTDTLARILSGPLSKTLGQAVVVENATGANGSLGIGRVVRALPDGYTLSIGNWGSHVLNGAVYSLQYDLLTDLDTVALLCTNPQFIVSKSALPATKLSDLIGWLKVNGDRASAGTAGAGSSSHVAGVDFQNLTGTKFQFVPYRGTGPAMQDLVAGRIDLMFDQASNSLPQVRAGKIRAYAVTAKTRLAAAPDIPTVDEAGLPGFYVSVWHGIWVPRGTPKDVVAKLDAGIIAALADTTLRQRLSDLGQEIASRDLQQSEGFARFHKTEIEKWWPIIKAAGIKVD